jgi:hypothetical protein
MPPISTNERDLAAESLLSQWITALATPAPASRLLNLATRAQALGGSATLIPGFTVADAPKTLLIRAAGPALIPFGVTGAIPRPTLTLYRDTQILAANTGWNTAANSLEIRTTAARIGAFAFPENSADSALLTTLAPGNYTAQITAANGATGVALVELYDADPTSTGTAGLINLSVRAQVGLGAQILIPGLTVGPGAAKTVLIRAIGPGLAQFNVAEREIMPIQQFSHLGSSQHGLGLGAAVCDCLGAQTLDAGLETVEGFRVVGLVQRDSAPSMTRAWPVMKDDLSDLY